MDIKIVIKFGKSSSKYYEGAISEAKKIGNFIPISENEKLNKIEINTEQFLQKYKHIETFWNIIGNWKSSVFLINGKRSDLYNLREYLTILRCNDDFKTAIIPEEHCKLDTQREGWSCKFLTKISLYPSYYSYHNNTYWFEFGEFVKEKIWRIDKEKIRGILKREAEHKKITVCKIFSFQKVEEAIDKLPDEIDLEKTDNWEIVFEENIAGNQIENKPIRIRPKGFSNQRSPWVGPSISFGGDSQQDKEDIDEEKIDRYIPKTSFDDIGGIDDIIQTIREVIELPLKRPGLFEYMGIKPHKGILLFGPPGCGKTLVAKAIANEINAHFIPIKGPELLSKWHGQSEENLRAIFEEARTFQPSIIFFDEIDSIAQKRSGEESLRIDSRFVNQLLSLMDGIEEYGQVCVIGSSNRQELIDPALMRPGRFDYSLEIKKPTKQGCCKVFQIATRKIPISKDFNLEEFSMQLYGLSGAEITFIAREAAYNCIRRNIDLKKVILHETKDLESYDNIIVEEIDFLLALQGLQTNKDNTTT